MAKSPFDSAEIGVRCPGCGHESKQQIGWLRTHDELACPGCGKPIRLDTEELRAGIQSANKAIDEFRRKLFRKR